MIIFTYVESLGISTFVQCQAYFHSEAQMEKKEKRPLAKKLFKLRVKIFSREGQLAKACQLKNVPDLKGFELTPKLRRLLEQFSGKQRVHLGVGMVKGGALDGAELEAGNLGRVEDHEDAVPGSIQHLSRQLFQAKFAAAY